MERSARRSSSCSTGGSPRISSRSRTGSRRWASLEDAGGASYLASLPNAVPTAANVEHYAGIVLEKSLLRSLIAAGTEMVSLGYDEGEEVETLLDRAERAVFAIGQRRRRQEPQSIREILWQSFEKIDRRYQHKGAVTGLATGFTDLDLMTSGLQPGT